MTPPEVVVDGRSLRAELTLDESNATKMNISGNNDGAGCIDKGNYNAQPQTTIVASDLTQSSCGIDVFIRHIEHL